MGNPDEKKLEFYRTPSWYAPWHLVGDPPPDPGWIPDERMREKFIQIEIMFKIKELELSRQAIDLQLQKMQELSKSFK